MSTPLSTSITNPPGGPAELDGAATDAGHMGAEEIYWVQPNVPTAARGAQNYPLFGADSCLHLTTLHRLFVFPGSLDVERFRGALAIALSMFPTFSGRLRHDAASRQWWIQLSDSPVPLFVRYRPSEEGLSTAPWAEDWTFGDLHNDSSSSNLVPHLPADSLENQDSPLLLVKLTVSPSSSETLLGVSIARQLADSYLLMEFSHCLSNCYQGLWLHSIPAFHVPDFPDPSQMAYSAILGARLQSSLFIFQPAFLPVSDVVAGAVAEAQNTASICVRITAAQSLKIRDIARSQITGESDANNISREHALAGFIVASINTHHPEPILQIGHSMNLRGTANPRRYGGNAMAFAVTDSLKEAELQRIGSIALIVCRALANARTTAGFDVNFLAAQHQVANVANEGLMLSMIPSPGQATIIFDANENWELAHFEFPGRVRYYASGYGDRTIRISHSNPELDSSGAVVDPRTGSLDVQFRLERSCRDAIYGHIAQQLEAL